MQERHDIPYHLTDDALFEVFARTQHRKFLLTVLRGAESLRKRTFRGHRITDSFPTNQQMLNAFRKECIEGRNRGLVWGLSCGWIATNQEIVAAGLKALDITVNNPEEAEHWIKPVQTALERPDWDSAIRSIVRATTAGFNADDIRIVVSIFGGAIHPQELRDVVDDALAESDDPQVLKADLAKKLDEMRRQLAESEATKLEFDDEHSRKTVEFTAELAATTEKHTLADGQCAELEEAVAAVERQIATLNEQLSHCQANLKGGKQEREKLAKAVDRLHKEMTSEQAEFEKECRLVSEDHERFIARMTQVAARLDEVSGRVEGGQTVQETLPAEAELEEVSEEAMPTLSSPTSVSDPVDERSSVTDNNALCYQAIQRIFRNAVVALLRDRMPRVYPSDHVERLKRPFGKEWARTAEHAQYSRQNGGTTTAVRDDYDPLGTNHFYSLFDAYYEKLFSAQAGHPPHLAKPARPRLLGNLKAIKDSRDPLSHPVEEEIPDEEAHHLLLDTRQVLQWLGCEAAAAEIAAVDAKLSRRDMPTITVPRKLPSEDSIYFDFVGRDTLLGELKSSFEKPDDKRCLLAGDGGKGKSAVAYRFAQHLADNPGRFHIIIWLSAKRLKFNGTILPIDSPDFTTIEEAVTRLLVEYGATTQDLQQSLAERKRLLLEYLTEYPAFIIADDIDTVLDDSDIVSLFTHDIPYTPSAVLLTSRRAIPGIRSLVVTGFDADEAAQFVRSRSHLYGLDPRPFTNKVISQVTQATDGSPLYLDDLLKLMRILDVQSAIRVWNDRKGDEARKYALQREMEQLSEDARKVLIAAAISDHPISLAELESILTFSEDRLIGTLMELQTLFLMPQTPVAEGEKRFQINLNTKKLVRSVEGGSDRYLRIEHASKAVTGKLPVVGPGIASSLIRQAQLRINAGKNTDAEKLLSSAIEKYPTVLDLRVFLAVFYKDTGRIADARIQFEKAAKMKTPGADMFIQWAQMEIDRGEWSKAIEAADRGLRIVQDCYRLIEQKVLAQREVGFDFLARNHQERASQTWAEAVDLISRRIKSPEKLPVNDRHLNSSMFCTMVVCLDMLGRHAERNQWLDRWEKENPEDPQLQRQKDELLSKHGTLKASAR